MKLETIVQANGNELVITNIEKAVKDEVKSKGVKVKDIKSISVYVKPNENEVYYTCKLANESEISNKLGA